MHARWRLKADRAINASQPIWRLPHSRKSPLWVKSGHQRGDGVGLLCAIGRNRKSCRAWTKSDASGSSLPRQPRCRHYWPVIAVTGCKGDLGCGYQSDETSLDRRRFAQPLNATAASSETSTANALCALRMVASRFGGYRTLAKVRFGSKADIRVAMELVCYVP